MTDKLRYLIAALFGAATLAYGIMLHYSTIAYYKDYLHGTFIDLVESFFPFTNTYTIVNHRGYKKYIKTYARLPREFIHAGNVLIFRAKEDTVLNGLVPEMIPFTDYFRESRLKEAVKKYNGLTSGKIARDSLLIVPQAAPSLLPKIKNESKPDLVMARGLYFTGTSAGSDALLEKLEEYRNLGINTIVFDAKDIEGIVNYHSRVPEVRRYDTHEKRFIGNIEKLIRVLKTNNFHTVARIAVFHDHLLRKREPGFAIRSKRSGGAWNPESKEKWCDPTSRKVQDYNINIAVELVDLGVDEIQFDYIRFPTTGDLNDAHFKYDFGKMTNEESIAHFLKRAYDRISSRNALLSIDIFGVVAWGKEIDINSTGQRIELLSRYCDIISPMLYPSHFNDNFDGYTRPGDNPYYFIYRGCKKVAGLAGKRAVVRPWLQAFRWHVSNYNSDYILSQIKACSDSGVQGYLFWNASNEYDTVLRALDRIKSGNVKWDTLKN